MIELPGSFMPSYQSVNQEFVDIEAIDYYFSKEIVNSILVNNDLNSEQQALLFYLLIVLSVSLRAGHTCLPINEIAGIHWGVAFNESGDCSHQGYLFPDIEEIDLLLSKINLKPETQQLIVFEKQNLYIRRYYLFESELSQAINNRISQQSTVNVDNAITIINQLFPSQKTANTENIEATEIDWQKLAVANSINKSFSVIAGGPGTGKTYTVTKLLAALLMLKQLEVTQIVNNSSFITEFNREDIPLDISLVAPTGKAAQRLSESITNAISNFKGLISNDILTAIPTQAKTIHRLLGVIPNNPNFRHNQSNLLSCDVLLIDEVSMVDLPMMTRIFRALKADTKVIMLGDADQLPSVAVGSVLADVAPRPHHGYSDKNVNFITKVCQLESKRLTEKFNKKNTQDTSAIAHDHLSFLVKSRRFDGEGGIGKLATKVIQGEVEASWCILSASLKKNSDDGMSQLTLVDNDLSSWLTPIIKQYYQGISQCNNVSDAFKLLSKFRVLCVTRQGEFGVAALNQWIKNQLFSNLYSEDNNVHGLPIMINENDYRLGLYNGDIGLLWRTDDGELKAYFENSESGYQIFMPSRLPKYDSVYAMTIHKTQGSEFDHVAIVLPRQSEHQLLSRELLYTGITRAKSKLTIACNKQIWSYGVKTAIKRYSGLKPFCINKS